METRRDVAMLKADLRPFDRSLPVAVEMWAEGGSPSVDEPVGQAFYDEDAGYFVLELLRRQTKGGPYAPLGMGPQVEGERDPRASDVRAPAGTITVGSLMDALSGAGSAELVGIRLWHGDDPKETDVGVYTVMEFPLGDVFFEGDGSEPGSEKGKFYDTYGNEVPEEETRPAYVVIGNMEGQF